MNVHILKQNFCLFYFAVCTSLESFCFIFDKFTEPEKHKHFPANYIRHIIPKKSLCEMREGKKSCFVRWGFALMLHTLCVFCVQIYFLKEFCACELPWSGEEANLSFFLNLKFDCWVFCRSSWFFWKTKALLIVSFEIYKAFEQRKLCFSKSFGLWAVVLRKGKEI